jgi:hypothetical protein
MIEHMIITENKAKGQWVSIRSFKRNEYKLVFSQSLTNLNGFNKPNSKEIFTMLFEKIPVPI